MTKAADKKLEMMKYIETQNVLKFNEQMGRKIPYEEYDEKILNKRDYYRHKKDHSNISIELNEKVCKVPSDFALSNLPILVEKRSMQDYHFEYTAEQLKNMYKTPKIIVDKFCSSFSSSSGVIQRTSFYMVAPNAQRNIPSIYRLSITTNQNEKNHYNIAVHGIVGGKEDGWLFLGRFDNDVVEPHKVAQTEYSRKELKKYKATKIEHLSPIDMRIREKAKIKKSSSAPDVFCVPFPHMHKPFPSYELGSDIESYLPKFMRNCVYNSFEQNVSYIMKIFNIYDHPHFRKKNELISDILKEEKQVTTICENPKPQQIVDELFISEQVKDLVSEYEKKSAQKRLHKQNKRPNNKKEQYIQRKDKYMF